MPHQYDLSPVDDCHFMNRSHSRGIISEYPAHGQRLSGEEIDKARLVADIAVYFAFFGPMGCRIHRRSSRQLT